MDTSGRKLGWIAIAIGVIALLVALSGRGERRGFANYGNFGPQQQYAAPFQGGQGNFGPQNGPQNNSGQQFGGRGQFGGPGQFNQNNGWRGPFRGGPGFHHGPGLFFLPFMIIGGLARLLFFGLLIFLVIKLISWARRLARTARRLGWPVGPRTARTAWPRQRPNAAV